MASGIEMVNIRSNQRNKDRRSVACKSTHCNHSSLSCSMLRCDLKEFVAQCDTAATSASVLRDLEEDRLSHSILQSISEMTDTTGGTILHWSARMGHQHIALLLLGNNNESWRSLILVQDRLENTALHCACLCNQAMVVEVFMQNVESSKVVGLVFKANKFGITALHLACRYSGEGVAKNLLGCVGANHLDKFCMRENKYGSTSLHWACRYGQAESAKIIVDKCGEKKKLLMVKTRDSSTDDECFDDAQSETFALYGLHATDPTSESLVHPKTNGGSTAFHWASIHGHANVVKTLLKAIPKQEALPLIAVPDDFKGNTALHWASGRDHAGVIGVFVDYLAENFQKLVKVKSKDGNTALHWACGRGHIDVFKVVVDSINASVLPELVLQENARGQTALHWACNTGHAEVIRVLLKKLQTLPGDSTAELVKVTDDEGSTALHVACKHGRTKAVDAMMSSLAQPIRDDLVMIQDNNSWTGLHLACDRGHTNVTKVFSKKLNPHVLLKLVTSRDEQDVCALEAAIENKHFEIVPVLLEKKQTFFENILQKLDKSVVVEACQRGVDDAVVGLLNAANQADRTGKLMSEFLRAEDDDGKNVLHIACHRRNKSIVKEILRFVKDLDPKKRECTQILCHTDNMGRTVLLEFAHKVNNEIILLILDTCYKLKCVESLLCLSFWDAFEAGINVVVVCILKQAVKSKCVRKVLFCTDNKHNNQTVIHRACQSRYDNLPCLKTVLDTANKHSKLTELLCQEDVFGRTFLFYTDDARVDILLLLTKTITALDIANPDQGICHWFLTNPDKKKRTVLHCVSPSRTSVLVSLVTPIYDALYKRYARSTDGDSSTTTGSTPGVQGDTFQLRYRKMIKEHTDEYMHIIKHSEPSDFRLVYEEKPFTRDHADARVSLLDAMGDSKCIDMIQHDYTKAYLRVCWKTHVKYFFIFNLVLYGVLLLFLTCFVATHKFHISDGISATIGNASVNDPINISENAVATDPETIKTPPVVFTSISPEFTNVCQYFLIMLSILTLVYEILQMVAKRTSYWSTPGNYGDLSVSLGCLVISVASVMHGYGPWIHQLGIATMCLAWMNAAWMLTLCSFGKFKMMSLMFVMLFRVIRIILIFLPVIGVFILTMSLSYCSLLQNQESFSHLGYSIMKTMVMTIGEMEFESMFFPGDSSEKPPFYFLTCIIFVMFLGIMNLAIINLLVGRAVGDIHELSSHSEVIAFKSVVDISMESQAMSDLVKQIKNKLTCHRDQTTAHDASITQPILVKATGV